MASTDASHSVFPILKSIELKGTNLRGETAICGFHELLTFSAVSRKIGGFPAKICGVQMLSFFPLNSSDQGRSMNIEFSKQFARKVFLYPHGCKYRRGMYLHRNEFFKNFANY